MLAKNIFILSLVHVVRLILPLLIIPILTNRISTDNFGIYMYAISFSAWLSIFIEYGFNISSTREIAYTTCRNKISEIIESTQSAKLILTATAIPIFLIAILIIPLFKNNFPWAITAWLLGVLTAFSPIYYFQGREKLEAIGLIEVLTGLSTLIAVYFLIHDNEEFYRLPLILLAARTTGLILLTRKMHLDAGIKNNVLCNVNAGKNILISGFNLFLFQGAVSFYTSFNVVFLGFFCTPAQVGAYAVAERLMRAGVGFIGQFSNAIFPRLNALKLENMKKMNALRLQVFVGFFLIGIFGMVITWHLSPFVVKYIFSSNSDQVIEIISILALLVPAIAISNVLGVQYLLVDRHENLFNKIIICAAIINIFIAYLLIQQYEAEGMAISWVLIEWLITISLAIAVLALERNKT